MALYALVMMALAVTLLIIYPIVTLILCWNDKEAAKKEKIAWTIFIVLSWMCLGIGSLIYGFIKHKSYYKLFPTIIVIIGLLTAVYITESESMNKTSIQSSVKTENDEKKYQKRQE